MYPQLILLDTEPTEKEHEVLHSWADPLKGLLSHPKTQLLRERLKEEIEQYTVYPRPSDWFRVFRETNYNDVKVVILGQDPYYNGDANGLAFGTDDRYKYPKSLQVILKAANSIDDVNPPHNYSLVRWAKQGVLLLNTCFTVRAYEAHSHSFLGWRFFVRNVLKATNRLNPVYLLWGNSSQEFERYIENKAQVLKAEHPASSLYNQTDWLYEDCFNKCNLILSQNKRSPILW
jgi:uracil-DNA glycosylase